MEPQGHQRIHLEVGRRQPLAALAGILVALASGCGRDQAPAPSAPTAPTTVGPPATTAAASCAPAASSPGGRITDPNGPYFHRVAVGQTADGFRVTGVQHVLEHASVPDGVLAPDGRVLIYYVDGDNGSVWVARYAAGAATPIAPIAINGVARAAGIVDPDAFAIDGRIRLAYLAAQPGAGAVRSMCIADSSDGVNFTVTSTALTTTESWTDPSITRLPGGEWLMAISAGTNTVFARSSNGQTFTAGERVTFGGVPEITTLDDGRVRLYVCARGIDSYLSADGGRTWTREGVVIEPSGLTCDPSRVVGTNLFVYKTGY